MSKKSTSNETATPATAPTIAASKPIILLCAENPKVPGSKARARFALYATNATVAQYVAACIAAGHSRRNAVADIAWDLKHGFIAHEKPEQTAQA